MCHYKLSTIGLASTLRATAMLFYKGCEHSGIIYSSVAAILQPYITGEEGGGGVGRGTKACDSK